ncbi:MAG: hypothetical protein HC830_05505 [Bacteroidetes bacterium]|nr:hypothetical protein [Bacteroidota bacterium]
MKAIPCYIGIVKAMIALSDYKRSPAYKYDENLESKLKNRTGISARSSTLQALIGR